MSAELPVAVVGIGCKFPGGSDSKELYYDFLRNKGDGMAMPPLDRWDDAAWQGEKNEPGKYNTTMAGFINGLDSFDPLEFGIAMNEARHMDPSLRLSLEVAHQALLDSGIDYRGSNTGVYFGQLLTSTSELVDDLYDIDSYHALGKCIALRANRISFTFDLRGPSLTLDTACSSSATAMHLALSAIKLGEIDQALIIGGNTIVYPEHMIFFSKLGVLSPTGSSKSFDASADGYSRAEGFAAVLVKRLDKAIVDKDHIYSVITGSSINSNGKGTGLTMPEGRMQAETILQAYSAARRSPSEAFYAELHCTGTSVGDPIEVNAAGLVFSEGRDPAKVLRVGSVKANVGHTEGCSFLASLIKVSLMLKKKEIIPNIRYTTPNPGIAFKKLLMNVQTELEIMITDLAAPDGKWVASVSSHGIGGSNAHFVVETFESVSHPTSIMEGTAEPNTLHLFLFAALTESNVFRIQDSLAVAYRAVTDGQTLGSLSYDLARRSRSCLARAFAVGHTLSSDLKLCKPIISNPKVNPELCLVFAGQGPQHIFMGRELSSNYRVFLDVIMLSDDILVNEYGKDSFLERSGLFVPGRTSQLSADGIWPVQDVIYSIVFMQLALVDLLRHLGIEYGCLVGHSLGEIAMGYAAGCYNRTTAIGIGVARAESMMRAEGNGCMVALDVGVQKAMTMIRTVLFEAKATDGLWISGVNSPQAVTVGGRQELIDALIKFAASPSRPVSAKKLRVSCAFHTALMDPQRESFKARLNSILSSETCAPNVRVMSTVDGKWLERDLGVDYWWDNIRQPVLFGTSIDRIVRKNGPENVLFLELSPHPVLSGYINQCGGKPFNLIYRPNPKVPAQNTGEHRQFLEGVGHLLTAGLKTVDLAKLCAAPHGTGNFDKCAFPEYPYTRSTCWSESPAARSTRLRQKPRPLSSVLFRISADTHPELTGHMILGVPLFPASGYLESILENGAMIVKDVHFQRPLVLEINGKTPAYVGCIIRNDKWEFRASTTHFFDNGNIQLDTIYASGSFLRVNPRLDPGNLRFFDVNRRLASSNSSVTGEEFYNALPSAYGYQGHFSNYIKEIHELTDEHSWHGLAYLARLEIPAGTSNTGYIIHPGVLDSAMHCALAAFINTETKLFDFDGVYLPVKVDSFTLWDKIDFGEIDKELGWNIWSYFTVRTFTPDGPLKLDFVIAGSDYRVLFTIEGFEIAPAPRAGPVPITDDSMDKRLTVIWQPKHFPSQGIDLDSVTSIDAISCLRSTFIALIDKAQTGGRYVVRILDLDSSLKIAKSIDASLIALDRNRLIVDYFIYASSVDECNKAGTLQYSRLRPFTIDPLGLSANRPDLSFASFDMVFQAINISHMPSDPKTILKYLAPFGVLLIMLSSSESAEALNKNPMSHERKLANFIGRLRELPCVEVSVASFGLNDSLVLVHSYVACVTTTEPSTRDVRIHHFTHGNEGQLAELVRSLSSNSELWVVGNDDASGVGALVTAACLLSELPEYSVHSLLFEDHNLCPEDRETIIRSLRQNPSLEQHSKITCKGEVFVRRLVYASPEVKFITVPGMAVAGDPERLVSAYFPRCVGVSEVQVTVDAFCVDSPSANAPVVTFVGRVAHLGIDVKNLYVGCKVICVASHPTTNVIVVGKELVVKLPQGITEIDAAALATAFLSIWIALVKNARITDQSTVLVHDAGSRLGFNAVQICQHFGAKLFCTVSTADEAEQLSTSLKVDKQAIITLLPGDELGLVVRAWLSRRRRAGFDIILNPQGGPLHAAGIDLLTPMGCFIHNQRKTLGHIDIPSGAPTTHVIDVSKLIEYYPSEVVSSLLSLLDEHITLPFQIPFCSLSLSKLPTSATPFSSDSEWRVLIPDDARPVRVNPACQLFDPRKHYLLVGGSSELGVRIAQWMASHGARQLVLTSRRGLKALTNIDLMYLQHLQAQGVSVDVASVDALNQEEMSSLINRANDVAPIGGIFLMTVVLRDGTLSHLNQQSFDDVYQSKVHTLHTLLSCVNPENLDFLLLFSTIGSIFGNAGQAAYCASQSYLDQIAGVLPNTISISLPPIMDSGIFKRLMQSMKGRVNTGLLAKAGMNIAQVCSFIGDSLIRRIPHYVPMMAIQDIPEIFPACEPFLYNHLLPVNIASPDKGESVTETPATLLAKLVGLSADQISNNLVLASFGLDSLGALRYSTDLKVHFNIQVSQIELLGPITIGLLNERVYKAGTAFTGVKSSVEVDDGTVVYGAPLTPILNERLAYGEPYTTDASQHQYRMYLSQKAAVSLTNDNASLVRGVTQWSTHEGYFISLTFSTPLDINRMNEVITEIIQRHGALRTSFFLSQDGKLKQTIHPAVDFKISVVDLEGEIDAVGKSYQLSLAINEEPNFRFDQPPLLKVTMFNLGNDRWAFNIVIHHIVMDEISLGIFFRELFIFYLGHMDSFRPVRLHFSDFSDWVIRTPDHRTQLREEQLQFWAENLKDAQSLDLSLSTINHERLSPVALVDATIDARALTRYNRFMSKAGATPFAGFLAVYNILLSKYSKQASFVVGATTSHRNVTQLADVIGFFANVLPVKTTINQKQPFDQYLAAFKADLMESLKNGDVAYEEIVSQATGQLHFSGYFKHCFTYDGFNLNAISKLRSDDVEVQAVTPLPLPTAGNYHELHLTVHGETGRVILRFDNRVYSEDTAKVFLNAYITLVKNLGHDPHSTIRDISPTVVNEHDCLGVRFVLVGEGKEAKLYVDKV